MNSPASPSRIAAGSAVCWLLLAVLTLYLLRTNDAYYRANTRIPSFDEAWYLETSLHLYHRLTNSGLHAFWNAYRSAFGNKAPLIAVLPLPFYFALGPSYFAALLVNSAMLIISNLFLYLLARRWYSPAAGLAAVAFYQTMPLAVGLSRSVMTEYALSALVIVWFYCLAASERLSRGAANLALGCVLGLGLLMKVLFPAFVAIPLLVVYLLRRKSQTPSASDQYWVWRACASWPLTTIAAAALGIAATWYSFHLRSLLNFAWQSAYGQVAEAYGAGLRQWLIALVNEGTSFHYALAIFAAGGAALLTAQGRPWGKLAGDERTLTLGGWVIPPLVALGAGRNHLLRFALPILPAFAILLSALIFSIGRSRAVQVLLAAVLMVLPLRLYAGFSQYEHGAPGPHHPARWGPFIWSSHDLGWAHPPVWENDWDRWRVIEALHQLQGDSSRQDYVVVGLEHVYFNANLLSYLNAYKEYPLLFTSLGYAESSPLAAAQRLYQFDARFLALGEGFYQLPPFLNQVNGQIRDSIARGELPFRLQAEVPLVHRMKILIYERDEPWMRLAGNAPEAQPSHAWAADFAGGLRFLGYDWKQRTASLWEFSTYWSVSRPLTQQYRLHIEVRSGGDRVLFGRELHVGGARDTQSDWALGDVVRRSGIAYVPPQTARPLEAWLWLVPWGLGPADPVTSAQGSIHNRVLQLNLNDTAR